MITKQPSLHDLSIRFEILRQKFIGKEVEVNFDLPVVAKGQVIEMRMQHLYLRTKRGLVIVKMHRVNNLKEVKNDKRKRVKGKRRIRR